MRPLLIENLRGETRTGVAEEMMAEPDKTVAEPTERSEIRRRALTGVISVGLRGVGIRLLGLLGYLVTARLLAPQDFGIAALGLTITAAAHFLADAGIGAALLKQPKSPERRDYAAVVGFQLLILLPALMGCAVWTVIAESKTSLVTTIFVAALPLITLRLPAGITFERELRFGPSVRADLTEVLVYNVFIVLGAAMGLGVYALALGTVVKTIVGTTVLNRFSAIGYVRPSLEFARVRGLLRFGLTFQATSGVAILREQAMNFGIAALAGYGVLGLWVIAGRLVTVPLLVFESLMRVSFPAMARLQATGADLVGPMERQTRRSTVLVGMVLAPAAVASTALVPTILGSKWDEAADVLPFVFFGVLVSQPVSVVATGFLLTVNDASSILRVAIAFTLVQVGAAAILLPTLGYLGLGVASLCGSLVDGLGLARATHRHCAARLLRYSARGSLSYLPAVGLGLIIAGGSDNVVRGAIGIVSCLLLYLIAATILDRESVSDLRKLVAEIPAIARRARDAADDGADREVSITPPQSRVA